MSVEENKVLFRRTYEELLNQGTSTSRTSSSPQIHKPRGSSRKGPRPGVDARASQYAAHSIP